MRKIINKNENGITLIALVITIIVLLILAGVAISMLSGENGILKQAAKAKVNNEQEEEKEKIALAVNASTISEKVDRIGAKLEKELNGEAIVVEGGDSKYVYFKETGNTYKLEDNNIEKTDKIENAVLSAFSTATMQTVNGKEVYAIDSNGNDVDMTNWEYCYDIQTKGYALNDERVLNNSEYGGTEARERTKGYLGTYTEDGEIAVNVPAYIKEDKGWIEVTSMYNTFYGCEELKIAPEIPNTVTMMWSTYQACTALTKGKVGNGAEELWNCFYGCTSLVTTPMLPDSVRYLRQTFEQCTGLENITNIPKGVTSMHRTFLSCKKIKTSPDIPNTVTSMNSTFSGCSLLEESPKIGENVTDMYCTFYQCTGLTTAPEIPDSVVNMASTFRACTNLITPPPTIPKGVVNLRRTFLSCTKLEGTIEINANMTKALATTTENDLVVGQKCYYECFKSAATSGAGLIVTTKNEKLKENDNEILKDIVASKSSTSNITIK